MTESVVKGWLALHCTFKQQTVLLSALRGCDGKPKDDPSKTLTKALRDAVLYSADKDRKPGSFMSPEDVVAKLEAFLADLDHYPVHWLMHFAHACEIIGYKHPDIWIRRRWLTLYRAICEKLNVMPEDPELLDARLADNR